MFSIYRPFLALILLSGFAMSAAALPEIDSLWDYDHPAVSEARFRSMLPDAANESLDYQLQLRTQIARALGLQRKFSDALTMLDYVDNHLPPAPCIARIRYLLERGRVFNSTQEQARALPYFRQALSLATKMKADFYAVDAAHMLAIASDLSKQMDWNLEALRLAERSQDPRARKWLGSLYNNIGWTYHDLGQFKEALDMFQKSLSWNREHKTGEGELIAEWAVARALRSLGKIDDALSRQQQ